MEYQLACAPSAIGVLVHCGGFGLPVDLPVLYQVDYLGHTVNFKTHKQSYKSRKILMNDPDEWIH